MCPHCKKERPTTLYEKKLFKQYLDKDVDTVYDVKDSCENCRNGYSGRIAIQEVLLIDDHLRDAINNENFSREDLRNLVYTSDVTTLLQDGLEKVLEGITSFEEIYKLIEIDDELDNLYGTDIPINPDNNNNTNTENTTSENNNPNDFLGLGPNEQNQQAETLNLSPTNEYPDKTELLDLGTLIN